MMNKLLNTVAITAALMGAPAFAEDSGNAEKSDSKSFRAGLEVRTGVTAADAGLPTYPGAKAVRDKNEKSDSVKFGLWAGDFGVKLVVAKFESPDSPEKVAAFYQKALTQFGTVLDCSKPGASGERKDKDDDNAPLTCERDRANKDGFIYKVGTRKKQRIAAVQPAEQGAVFQLIYVEKRGSK